MTHPNPPAGNMYQDYVNTPDDERYELLGGYLVLIPPAGRIHQVFRVNHSCRGNRPAKVIVVV